MYSCTVGYFTARYNVLILIYMECKIEKEHNISIQWQYFFIQHPLGIVTMFKNNDKEQVGLFLA